MRQEDLLPFDQRHAVPVDGRWRVRVLGGLTATSGDVVVRRFPGRAVAGLLARLAFYPGRSHSREELIELLWPGLDPEIGRPRLRQTLSTLRQLLEPPGVPPVLEADRQTVRVCGRAITSDATAFEAALHARKHDDAIALYGGELLPGMYEEWVQVERERLAALHDRVVQLLEQRRVPSSSLDAAPATETQRSLPHFLSSFFGRDADREALDALVQSHRLACLSGTAGCGKTRLAVEMAQRIAGFERVLFVPLAACSDGARVADHVRAASGLPGAPGDALTHVAAHHGGRRVLFVLDNFEQLVDAGGPQALAALLDALPLSHVLVTSRRVARLEGEVELALAPLAEPDEAEPPSSAARNPAVALFVDRARSVRSNFRLTTGNVADVIDICRTLGGLPLALELAASRIRTYAPRELAAEVRRGFAVLARGGAQAERLPRHASLNAAVQWSWDLLDAREQAFLADLSVFRGAFGAAEAASVTGAARAHDLLDSLAADSLLQQDSGNDEDASRFRMLPAVREFMHGRVAASRTKALQHAHRCFCIERVSTAASAHRPIGSGLVDDVLRALQTALDDGDHDAALTLGLATQLRWEWVGTPPEALALFQRAAEESPETAIGLPAFLGLLARLLVQAGEPRAATAAVERAIALARSPIDRVEALFSHVRVAWVWKRDGDALAGPARDALAQAVAAGSRELEGRCLLLVGAIALWHRRDAVAAERAYVDAANAFASIDHAFGVLQTWHGRMACLQAQNRHVEAIVVGRANEARAEAIGHSEARVLLFNLLALSYEKTRRFADALDACQQEARLSVRWHKVYNIAYGLWNQCRPLARLGRPEDAARMMAFSQKYWVDQFGPLHPGDERGIELVRRLVVRQLGEARWHALWREGLSLPVHEGIRLGTGEA